MYCGLIATYCGFTLAHVRRAEKTRTLTPKEAALLAALKAFLGEP